MSAALDVLVVAAAKVPTESLRALATGSDAPHAPVWAFEVTGDVISAGEPGGRMLVRKITDNGRLLSAANCKPWPGAGPGSTADAARPRRRGDRVAVPFAAVHSVASGTKRTFGDLSRLSAFGGKADMHRGVASTASVADDPQRTFS